MLPLPTLRSSSSSGSSTPSTSSIRRLVRRIDAHTLWAFNPQRPLGR